MDGVFILDWLVRLFSWAMMAGIGFVMIALYGAMRRKGNVVMAEIYWWFLTIQAVAITVLSAIKLYEGINTANVLFCFALAASVALIWARITRPQPKPYENFDS